MAWRKLTEEDLVAALSRDEVEAYRRDFETDPVPELLSQTANWARGYIRTNGLVRMDPTPETLPESCVGPAIDYTVIAILKRLMIEPNETRAQARQDAITYFRDISAGKNRPEDFDTAATEQQMVAAAPAFSPPKPERLLD